MDQAEEEYHQSDNNDNNEETDENLVDVHDSENVIEGLIEPVVDKEGPDEPGMDIENSVGSEVDIQPEVAIESNDISAKTVAFEDTVVATSDEKTNISSEEGTDDAHLDSTDFPAEEPIIDIVTQGSLFDHNEENSSDDEIDQNLFTSLCRDSDKLVKKEKTLPDGAGSDFQIEERKSSAGRRSAGSSASRRVSFVETLTEIPPDSYNDEYRPDSPLVSMALSLTSQVIENAYNEAYGNDSYGSDESRLDSPLLRMASSLTSKVIDNSVTIIRETSALEHTRTDIPERSSRESSSELITLNKFEEPSPTLLGDDSSITNRELSSGRSLSPSNELVDTQSIVHSATAELASETKIQSSAKFQNIDENTHMNPNGDFELETDAILGDDQSKIPSHVENTASVDIAKLGKLFIVTNSYSLYTNVLLPFTNVFIQL